MYWEGMNGSISIRLHSALLRRMLDEGESKANTRKESRNLDCDLPKPVHRCLVARSARAEWHFTFTGPDQTVFVCLGVLLRSLEMGKSLGHTFIDFHRPSSSSSAFMHHAETCRILRLEHRSQWSSASITEQSYIGY